MAIIKTLGDFRRLTKDLNDDFSIEFRVRTRVPDEELKNRRYPYPYDTEYFDGFEFDDVGYSDKVACFGVTLEATEGIHKTEKELKRKIEASMEQKPVPISCSHEKEKEQKPANNNKSEMSDENGHLTGKILVEYGAHAKVRDGKRHCEMEWKEFQRLAHHFYELGLKAKK